MERLAEEPERLSSLTFPVDLIRPIRIGMWLSNE